MHAVTTLAILALLPLAGAVSPPRVRVPLAPSPQVDGRLDAGEWAQAHRVELRDGGELLLQHDGADLYLALHAPAEVLGSVCLERDGSVHVLHASMALGRAQYARSERPGWRLERGFRFEMRAADFGTEARAQRVEYLRQQGWLANTTRMGDDRVREYRIAGAMLSEAPLRLAVAYMLNRPDGPVVHAWPHDVRDGCAAYDLVHGATPEELEFEPERWPALELVR